MDQKQMCIEDHSSTPSQVDACIAEADRTYHDAAKSHFLSYQTWPVILHTIGICTIYGLFWSFVVALSIRTIGCIALGFGKPAQS